MSEARFQRRKMSFLVKAAFKLQVFLLRHNLMGPAGNLLMVITTRGRKSGKSFSTPIAFVPDGHDILALNYRGMSDWYKNALTTGEAELIIKGRTLRVRTAAITDPAERQRILGIYQRERAGAFKNIFGVPADAPAEALQKSLADRQFIRFTPL